MSGFIKKNNFKRKKRKKLIVFINSTHFNYTNFLQTMNKYLLGLLLMLTFGFQDIMAQNENPEFDFYDTKRVQEIWLTFEQDNWQHLLDSLRYNGGDLLIGTAEVNGKKYENAGVRWRGTRSFVPGAARNGLNIKLDFITRSQKIQEHGSIKLSKSLRDPSMVREILSYEIARKYMPAPKANYARVYINKVFYGLFVNIEAVDDTFLNENFGSTDNPLFKVNQNADSDTPAGCKKGIFGSLEYEMGANCYLNNFEIESEDGWDELIKLTKTLNQKPENVSRILNVDRALWMLAFNNVVANLSSYSGKNSVNYFLYQDDNGQFNPIVWDMNLSFGSYKNTGEGSDLNSKQIQELDPLLHLNDPYKPLISKLLANEFYQKLYLSHVREIMRENFFNGDYEKRAKELQDLARQDFSRDERQSYTVEEFNNSLTKTIGKRSKIPGIVQLMSKRTKFLNNHPKVLAVPPPIKEVEAIKRAKFESSPVKDFDIRAKSDRYTKRMKIRYRLDGKGDFIEKDMKDDGISKDGTKDDGIFGVTIVPTGGEKMIEYYIWAENASMISFSPANYMWEKHTATLEALNK